MGRFKRVLGKLGRRAESHQDAGVPMPCVKIKSSSSNSLSTQTPSNAPVQSSQLQSDAGKPSARKDNLWLEARDKISCDDRESIKEFNPQGSGATELNVRSMVLDLQQKGEACKAESWKFRVGNHTANFQDAVNTALRWVDKVKGPIDIAVSADPVHAALPWAGIKFLILMVEANRDQIESLLSGMTHIFRVTRRCQLYEALISDTSLPLSDHSTEARKNVRSAIVELYALILQFLAEAARTLRRSSNSRALAAIWSTSVISQFENDCEKRERLAEREVEVFEILGSSHLQALVQNCENDLKDLSGAIIQVEATTSAIWEYHQGEKRGKILEWISEIDTSDQHQIAKGDRTIDTGTWLLGHHTFVDWESRPDSAILWLNGIPGAGKTKLVSKVIDYFESDHPGKSLAYFYCDRGAPQLRSPVNILRSYIKQLSTSRERGSIRTSIVERYDDLKSKGSSTKLNYQQSETLLSELINSNATQTTVLILDALDEAESRPLEDFLQSLELLLSSCSGLKVFISSRRDEHIKRHLQYQTVLGIEATQNQEDIRNFINSELDRMANSTRSYLSEELKRIIRDDLVSRNQGMFQWVAVLLLNLPKMPEDIQGWLTRFPPDLKGTYQHIVDEIEAPNDSMSKIAARAFDWVMGSFEPLHQDDLLDFIRRSPDGNGIEYSLLTIDHVLDACRNLLVFDPPSEGSFRHCRFMHLSVREYLEDRIPGEDGHTIHRQLHNKLALVTLGIILENNDTSSREWFKHERTEGVETDTEVPRVYAAKFWPRHASIALTPEISPTDETTERLATLIERLFSPEFSFAFENWVIDFNHDDGDSFKQAFFVLTLDHPYCAVSIIMQRFIKSLPDRLYYASLLDFDFLARKLISHGIRGNRKGAFGSAIATAGTRSSLKTLRALLSDSGAIRFEDYITILRNIRARVPETLAILGQFPIQSSDTVLISDNFGRANRLHPIESCLTKLAVEAAMNEKFGDQMLAVLLDTNPGFPITEPVMLAVAGNWDCGDRIMAMLLERSELKGSAMQTASKIVRCEKELTFIPSGCPTEQSCRTDALLDTKVIDAVFANCGSGKGIMKLLLDAKICDIVVTAARINPDNPQLFALLFKMQTEVLVELNLEVIAEGLDFIRRIFHWHIFPNQRIELTPEDVLKLATINQLDDGVLRHKHTLNLILDEGAGALRIPDLVTVVAGRGTSRNDDAQRALSGRSINGYSVPGSVSLAIKGGDRGLRFFEALGELSRLSAAFREYCAPSYDLLSKPFNEDIWELLPLDIRDNTTTRIVIHNVAVPITKTLLEAMVPFHRARLLAHTSHVTSGAVVKLFQDMSTWEFLDFLQETKAEISLSEDLIQAAAEVADGDRLISSIINTHGSQLTITELIVTEIAALLKASVMDDLLQECKDVPITRQVFEAAKANPRDADEMQNLLEKRLALE